MRSVFFVLAVGCASIASDAVSQTFPSTPLPALYPPYAVPQPADINPTPASQMTVSTEQAELRVAPNANATALGTFSFGTKVTVMDATDGWSHVNIGGRDGYISSQSVK
jgi:Bacterial SH3 domain